MKKHQRWTDEEDQVLVQLIQEYPHNKKRAFEEAALQLNRTENACIFRWYGVLGNPRNRKYIGTAFMVISRKSRYDNRTVYTRNSKTSPTKIKYSIWNRILNIFKK